MATNQFGYDWSSPLGALSSLTPSAVPAGTAGNTAPGTGSTPGIPQYANSTVGGSTIQGQAGNAITDPAAYGTIPQFAPTTTDTSSQVQSWTPSLPGYDNMSGQASGIAASEMGGQLPPDVIAQLQEQGAQRGISTGSPDSPGANAAYMQALGLNSLGMEQAGTQLYQSLLAGAPRTTTTDNTQVNSNANLIAEANAAPNPYLAAMANLGAGMYGIGSGQGSIRYPQAGPSATIQRSTQPSPFSPGTAGFAPTQNPYAPAGSNPNVPPGTGSADPSYNLGYDEFGNQVGVNPSTDPWGTGSPMDISGGYESDVSDIWGDFGGDY